MTPHRHWFRSYSPHVVPIQLADNSIIHSAGMGSVEFQPVIDGIPGHPVVLHDVLHVPNLGSNLLSLFHLTQVKGYIISLEANRVHFHYHSKLLVSLPQSMIATLGIWMAMLLFPLVMLLVLQALVLLILLYGITDVLTSTWLI